MKRTLLWLALFGSLFPVTTSLADDPPAAAAEVDAHALYQKHCATCHHPERLGGQGPALFPENLQRLPRAQAVQVIGRGRPATQMPGFDHVLGKQQIDALVNHIYQPPQRPLVWDEAAIRQSHVVYVASKDLPARPIFAADPLNLFVVVELGDHHVTILDGDRLEPLVRFPSRFNLHGGPKFSPEGRFVYFASRDGWISKYDLYNLKMVAEVRVGINARNLAISDEGQTVMVANYLPHTLVALAAEDLSLRKIIPVRDPLTGTSSRVSAVYDAPPRHTFVAALKDLPEVWEIPYNDKAKPVVNALVHDYRVDSGEALPVAREPFPIRRIRVDDYLDDFFFDPTYSNLIGATRGGNSGQVVNLDIGRRTHRLDLPGLPHLGSGITWRRDGTLVLATPNLAEAVVTVIDMTNWQVIKKIPTQGPGFFMRSHENTPYAWVDVSSGPNKDLVHVLDKQSLEIVATLRPVPGKSARHVEFTRDGRLALLSIWEEDGALIVYDAKTLQEVKRLPMRKPSGKYNIYNKITRSEGTSH
ncbi:MAG: c-type cytochrome [Magnetococcales bacterium]|nr:c-type cytochrome [Magnetococcales bacterium]